MRIEGVPEVGCGDEPPVTHSLYFRREALYQPISGKVFQDSIGIDDIEGFIGEGQRAAVEYDRLHAGETVTVILHVVEGNTTADNLRAVLVKGFKLLRHTNPVPDAPMFRMRIAGGGRTICRKRRCFCSRDLRCK